MIDIQKRVMTNNFAKRLRIALMIIEYLEIKPQDRPDFILRVKFFLYFVCLESVPARSIIANHGLFTYFPLLHISMNSANTFKIPELIDFDFLMFHYYDNAKSILDVPTLIERSNSPDYDEYLFSHIKEWTEIALVRFDINSPLKIIAQRVCSKSTILSHASFLDEGIDMLKWELLKKEKILILHDR